MEKGKLSQFMDRQIKDLKSLDIWRATSAEFLGTMLLVIFSVGTGFTDFYPSETPGSTPPSSTNMALEAGLYIGVIITVLGTISGGHVNPAISLGFVLTGNMTFVRFILYIIAQTIGGVAGAGLLLVLAPARIRGTLGVIEPASGVADEQALFCEVIITFFLLFGTFAMIDGGRKDLHGSVPLMIGLIVTINIFFAWNMSGGCMNPARSFGPAIVMGNTDKLWVIYFKILNIFKV
ncbi:hypothetical protein KUTeg_015010 [Tegillarca granosa]|uniref:Aquaporin n=1 Tax=Tegillarca granosa TaxID=220873 RepID=A0ABQ9ESI0_TEGGR|nr:hypothetical protein KUTeg_015010 [Tegillarca granosa]